MPRIIRVRVHSKAHDERVEEVGIDEFEVWITVVPSEGQANSALLEVLADYFNQPISTIRIKSGLKSRHKLIEID
ncbi:MAG TPA: DUF167 domain-containing protein [Verrucomicrobiae bacterium]|nr:DUF167 domain-containing protein [Verrucomicrobiae bacterium]